MSGPLDAWLAANKAAKSGGSKMRPIRRGIRYFTTLKFKANLSSDTFKAQLRSGIDQTGSPLADFTFTVGPFSNGVTLVTFAISKADVEALPPDETGTGVVPAYVDVLHYANGESANEAPLFAAQIDIIGAVTND